MHLCNKMNCDLDTSLGHCMLVSKQTMQLDDWNCTTVQLWLSHNPFSAFAHFQSSFPKQETSIRKICTVQPNLTKTTTTKKPMIKKQSSIILVIYCWQRWLVVLVQLVEWSNIWCVHSRLLYALLYQLLYYGLSRCYKSKSEKLLFEQQIKADQRQFVVVIHIRHGKTSRIYGACAAVQKPMLKSWTLICAKMASSTTTSTVPTWLIDHKSALTDIYEMFSKDLL